MIYSEIKSKYLQLILDLKFESNITFLVGYSSTGKSFLYTALSDISKIYYDQIVCFNYRSKNILENIRLLENKLIVIDNEEILITDEMRKEINKENKQYLLIGRDYEDINFHKGCLKEIELIGNVLAFKDG